MSKRIELCCSVSSKNDRRSAPSIAAKPSAPIKSAANTTPNFFVLVKTFEKQLIAIS